MFKSGLPIPEKLQQVLNSADGAIADVDKLLQGSDVQSPIVNAVVKISKALSEQPEPTQAFTNNITSATSRLSISNPIIFNTQATPIETPQDTDRPYPWEEQAEAAQTPLHRLATPDPADLERALALGDAKAPSPVGIPHAARGDDSNAADRNGRVSGEILREFDPLADSQEKDAQEAWASAEGHPRP